MADTANTLERRLLLAHQARRAKEHQLDDVRRALCDVGVIEDDDPYNHADLADVIRQCGDVLSAPPSKLAYPRPDGDVTVLGPETFASSDGTVISWKGVNYERQQPERSIDEGLLDSLAGLAGVKRGPGGASPLLARAEAAETEVARLRLGEDTTPVQPEAIPTPGQWIARWNNATSGQRLDMAARILDMQQEQTRPQEARLFQVGWYCWRCHGLVEKACRSDNVPVYVPVQWVQEIRREIAARAEENDGPDAAGEQR